MHRVGGGCEGKRVLYYDESYFDRLVTLLYCILSKQLFLFNAVKASCNYIRVFVSKYRGFWQLNPGPGVNVPYLRREESLLCLTNISRSQLQVCRSGVRFGNSRSSQPSPSGTVGKTGALWKALLPPASGDTLSS